MAPNQRGQKTLDGFFKKFTEPKEREASSSLSDVSTSSSTKPHIRLSEPLSATRSRLASQQRTWQSPDARKKREAAGLSKIRTGARPEVTSDTAQERRAVPHVEDGDKKAANCSTLLTPISPARRNPVARRSYQPSSDVRETVDADEPVTEPSDAAEQMVLDDEDHQGDGITGADGARYGKIVGITGPKKDSPKLGTPGTTSSATSPPSTEPRHLGKQHMTTAHDSKRTTAVTKPPTSSLTTLPETLSFSSTSTKRIARDGMEMVRNSDSESESEDSEPLEDLEVILARHAGKTKAAVPGGKVGSLSTPAVTARGRGVRASGTALSSGIRQTPTYKFTPGSLLKHRPESQDEQLDELRSLSDSDDDRMATVDQGALRALMRDEDDPGHAKRVMQAMQRTDALKEELAYYYLDPRLEVTTSLPAFPVSSLPRSGWQGMLKKSDQRQQTFTSGLAAKMSKSQPLPTDVLLWALDVVCIGTSDLLSLRYLEVLENSRKSLGECLNSKDFIVKRLSQLGPRESLLMDKSALVLKPRMERLIPPGLRWFLELLQILSGDFDQDTLRSAIHLTTRLLVDERISKDGAVFLLVQDTFAKLLSLADDSSKLNVHRSLIQTWKHAGLQESLIQALPARDGEVHAFRRQVAYAFALGVDEGGDLSVPTDLGGFAKVTEHVAKLARHNQSSDYAELASTIGMLDVAIDAGFSDRDFARGSDGEKSFNDAVSKLAAAVRELESSLIGGGMSNLHKTTAKAALDQLWCRLLYSVRTTPPPQKDFFAGFDQEQQRKVRFLSDWVKGGSSG